MSRAFVKEADGSEVFEDLPDRPVSTERNLVTASGLAMIEAETARLRTALAEAQAAGRRNAIAEASRDLRYWTARRANAERADPPADTSLVRFGHSVTVERADGRVQTFRIVGEDEADPTEGLLSHASPLARALMGKAAGDVIRAGSGEAEIVSIESPPAAVG